MIEYELERSPANLIYHQHNNVLESGAHFHSTLEFTLVTEGSQKVHVNKKDFVVPKNHAILILPGEVHWYEKTADSASYLCIFSGNYIPDFVKHVEKAELVCPVFPFDYGNIIEPFIRRENEYYVSAFLNLVAACAAEGGIRKISTCDDPQLIYQITEFIGKHYKEEISLKQLAFELGYNYTYLSNFFNHIFPQGFSRFINEYRVGHAKKLLEQTSLSMSEICEACGFPSIRTFNRAFLQIEKTSPKDYRLKRITT